MKGAITYFNEVAEKVFGFTAREVLNRSVIDTIIPAVETGSERDLTCMLEAILSCPEAHANNENENVTRDGRRIWVRWANQVLRDHKGRATGLLSIGQDITAQHQLEVELEQHQRQGLQLDCDLARPQTGRLLRQPLLHADSPDMHPGGSYNFV